MILVRNTYQLRFGRIDQAVDLFGRVPEIAARSGPAPLQLHALTDISGPMYTFVSDLVCRSLSEWDSLRSGFYEQPGFADWFKALQLITETGQHEFYTIEGEHAGWSSPGALVVREAYHAFKWQIRPVVGLLQRYGALLSMFGVGRNPRILTDLSGRMFRASLEIEIDNLGEWEQQRRKLYREPDFQAWFAQLSSAVEAGAHDFYRVELVQKFG
jgi:hypothetical protein